MSSSPGESATYEVEKVLDYSFGPPEQSERPTHMYLVKWVGYGKAENSWCCLGDMAAHDLIREYWRKKGSRCPHKLHTPLFFKRLEGRKISSQDSGSSSHSSSSVPKKRRHARVVSSSADESDSQSTVAKRQPDLTPAVRKKEVTPSSKRQPPTPQDISDISIDLPTKNG